MAKPRHYRPAAATSTTSTATMPRVQARFFFDPEFSVVIVQWGPG